MGGVSVNSFCQQGGLFALSVNIHSVIRMQIITIVKYNEMVYIRGIMISIKFLFTTLKNIFYSADAICDVP